MIEEVHDMRSLSVNNIRYIVSCDSSDTVYENVNLYCEDGLIKYIGPEKHDADTVIDASGMLCYPGLVNAHHHLYQVFSRNLEKVQNMELFDWLKTLYEIWKNLNSDTVYLSSLTGMGELMKNGCTTVFDHHYVFPKDSGDLIGAQDAAAKQLGVRMHFSRGSMDLSVKDGGLPPDSVHFDEPHSSGSVLTVLCFRGTAARKCHPREGKRSSSPYTSVRDERRRELHA